MACHNLPSIPIRSHRARLVARWFGLRDDGRTTTPGDMVPPEPALSLPAPGCITLITGPSGSGKSCLLRALRQQAQRSPGPPIRCIDLDQIILPDVPLVDCFDDTPLAGALALLGRVGLGEAQLYLKLPGELSDGQRWRLRLGLALHQLQRHGGAGEAAGADGGQRSILCGDEFAAALDRITALIVARLLRRAIRAPLAALLATSHDDLLHALEPDQVVRCDFGRIRVPAREGAALFRTAASTARSIPG